MSNPTKPMTQAAIDLLIAPDRWSASRAAAATGANPATKPWSMFNDFCVGIGEIAFLLSSVVPAQFPTWNKNDDFVKSCNVAYDLLQSLSDWATDQITAIETGNEPTTPAPDIRLSRWTPPNGSLVTAIINVVKTVVGSLVNVLPDTGKYTDLIVNLNTALTNIESDLSTLYPGK